MVDELAEKGVAGGLLRRIRRLVVVDERARPAPQLGTDDGAQRCVELNRFAHLLRRVRLARSRRPAAADSALGLARLVAETVTRQVLAGRSSGRRVLAGRRAAAVLGADRRNAHQHLLEL